MEVSNGTSQDTTYRVTGGNSGMAPIPWAKLKQGQRIRHPMSSRGPWKVHFRFAGKRKVYSAEAYSTDVVELIEAKSGDSYAVVVHSEAAA